MCVFVCMCDLSQHFGSFLHRFDLRTRRPAFDEVPQVFFRVEYLKDHEFVECVESQCVLQCVAVCVAVCVCTVANTPHGPLAVCVCACVCVYACVYACVCVHCC